MKRTLDTLNRQPEYTFNPQRFCMLSSQAQFNISAAARASLALPAHHTVPLSTRTDASLGDGRC